MDMRVMEAVYDDQGKTIHIEPINDRHYADPAAALNDMLEYVDKGRLDKLIDTQLEAHSCSVFVSTHHGALAVFELYSDGCESCSVSKRGRAAFSEDVLTNLASAVMTCARWELFDELNVDKELILCSQGYACTNKETCQWVKELEPGECLACFAVGKVESYQVKRGDSWAKSYYEPVSAVVAIRADKEGEYREIVRRHNGCEGVDPLALLAFEQNRKDTRFGEAGYPYRRLAEIVLQERLAPPVPEHRYRNFAYAANGLYEDLCIRLPQILGERFRPRQVEAQGVDRDAG